MMSFIHKYLGITSRESAQTTEKDDFSEFFMMLNLQKSQNYS